MQNCIIWIQAASLPEKTDDIYKDIAGNAETRSETSNYETDKPL